MRDIDEHGDFKQCRWCKGRAECRLPQDHACSLYEFDIVARNRCIKEDTRERERERIIAELDRKALQEKKSKKEQQKERKPPVPKLQIVDGKWCYVFKIEAVDFGEITFILESTDIGWVVFGDGSKELLRINRDKNNQRIFVYGKKNAEMKVTSKSLAIISSNCFNFRKFIEAHSLHF